MFGNLPPHPAVGKALQDAIDSGKYNGYDHSAGMETARRALAEYFSSYDEGNGTELAFDVSKDHSVLSDSSFYDLSSSPPFLSSLRLLLYLFPLLPLTISLSSPFLSLIHSLPLLSPSSCLLLPGRMCS